MLLAAITLLPVQIWPPLPLSGMQVSDVLFAAAFVTAPRALPDRTLVGWLGVFAVGAAISWLVSGGVASKLVGHFELVSVAWMVAVAWPKHGERLRTALVAAGVVAAVTGLIGVVLYYAGVDSSLLNPSQGDLVAAHYPRVRGTTVRANMLASVLATGLVLLVLEPSLLAKRGARVLAITAMCACLVFTFSRTIPAAGMAVCAAWLVGRRAPLWQWTIWASAAFIVAAVLWISIRYTVRLNPLDLGATEVFDRPGTRYVHWREAAWSIGGNTWFGVGPGVLVAIERSAHNTWLNLWGGLGVAPLIAFAVLLGKATRRASAVALLGIAAALWIAVSDTFHRDIEDMRHVWVLIGAAFGLAAPKGRNYGG